MGFRGRRIKLPPPPVYPVYTGVSWFSSTPAGIGLNI